MAFAIKSPIANPRATTFTFAARKTMYGGKAVAEGDVIFIFSSENEGGVGLVARGVVTSATLLPRNPGVPRQTPRLTISILRTALATKPLGRRELKPHANWHDGHPATELNFKFYRQATNKIVGITDEAATFLNQYFAPT